MHAPAGRLAPGRLRRIGVVVASVGVVFASIFGPAQVFAQSETPAEKAAREIQAARDRANEAAQAMFDAESEFDTLTVDIAEAEAELAVIEAEAAEMRSGLQDGAVYNFVSGGTGSFPLLIDLDATNDELAADVFVDVAYGNAAVELDDYDAVMDELETARADLEQQRTNAQAASERYAELKEKAEAEVVHLAEVEKDRVEDEAVQRELARQRAARIEAEQAAAPLPLGCGLRRGRTDRSAGGRACRQFLVEPGACRFGISEQRRVRFQRRSAGRGRTSTDRGGAGIRCRSRSRRRPMPAAASCARSPGRARSVTRGAPADRADAATRVST